MIRVNFVTTDGRRVVADAAPGQRLLELGQAVGMPLEGTCEGQTACPPRWRMRRTCSIWPPGSPAPAGYRARSC